MQLCDASFGRGASVHAVRDNTTHTYKIVDLFDGLL
jgi:hypothetical protein